MPLKDEPERQPLLVPRAPDRGPKAVAAYVVAPVAALLGVALVVLAAQLWPVTLALLALAAAVLLLRRRRR